MKAKTFLDNFGIIANAPSGLKRIRELILDLAVRGSLSKRLHDIESSRIIWDAKSLRLDEEKLWILPTALLEPKIGWQRIPMATFGQWGSGGTPISSRKDFYLKGTIQWAVIGDLNGGVLTETGVKITKEALEASSAKMVPIGAVLIAMYGASIGKVSITGIECCTNQAIAHCIPDIEIISGEYLLLLVSSLKSYLVDVGKGAAQPNISQTVLKHLMVDVPPIAEQNRIVAKVGELMALCDELGTQLKIREAIAEQLAKVCTKIGADEAAIEV